MRREDIWMAVIAVLAVAGMIYLAEVHNVNVTEIIQDLSQHIKW